MALPCSTCAHNTNGTTCDLTFAVKPLSARVQPRFDTLPPDFACGKYTPKEA